MDYYLQRVGSPTSPAIVATDQQQLRRRREVEEQQQQQRAARMATAHLYRLQQGMIKGVPGPTPAAAVQYRCERCGI